MSETHDGGALAVDHSPSPGAGGQDGSPDHTRGLAGFEDELKASMDKDADDALLCILADEGNVAMMVIDWDGSIYRNENALKRLQAIWRHSFDANMQTLVPIFTTHISQKNLGVAGIKWLPASSD